MDSDARVGRQPVTDFDVFVGCSVLPGHQASEPLTHTHHVDEVVRGRPPTCRAQNSPLAISFKWRSPALVLQPLGVVGLEPTELVTPPAIRLLRHLQLTADVRHVLTLAHEPVGLGSLRATCSGVCRFLVVIVIKPSCQHVGGKTLTQPRRGGSNRVRSQAPDPT